MNAKRLASNRARCARYRQKHRQKRLLANRKCKLACKLEVLSHYSSGLAQCCLCDEARLGALHVDHINNDGRDHRRDRVHSLYYWLKKHNFPPGFRILCSNCNWKEYLRHSAKIFVENSKATRQRAYTANIRATLMAKLGNKCSTCGIADIDMLTVHHKNHDGASHRKAVGANGGVAFYRVILNDSKFDWSTVECLCFSCNDNDEYVGYRGDLERTMKCVSP